MCIPDMRNFRAVNYLRVVIIYLSNLVAVQSHVLASCRLSINELIFIDHHGQHVLDISKTVF